MDSRASATLVEALSAAAAYPHPVGAIQVLETHISWVFLTGFFAYKVKKPVKLGFVDFSTLEARHHYCREELRLNRRVTPALYLDVVEIRATPAGPRIGGSGLVIEYAVRMRQFPQEALASRLLAAGALTRDHVDALAKRVAAFHAGAPAAGADSPHGTIEAIAGQARANFDETEPLLETDADRRSLAALKAWTTQEALVLAPRFRERRHAGRVRECHGDLHLSNVALIGDALQPFDCIEFDPALRWIDVMSEAAFLVMDLAHRGAPKLAWTFLNAYLEATGDYGGMAPLRFYVAYRAMVRAKIHLIRARQATAEPTESARLTAVYRSYAALAAEWSRPVAGSLVLMHGLSGSGKSTIARELAPALSAIRVRSDIERKRIHGAAALSRLYGAEATRATYDRLAEAAADIARAGYTAIVDATFLRADERARFVALARELAVHIVAVDVTAPEALLRERIVSRAREARDASDATLGVLEGQIATREPIADGEGLEVIRIDGATGYTPAFARTVACALRGPRATRCPLPEQGAHSVPV